MLSMIFARRAGMIAVWGIGSPSGWRKRAVTANQSARPPTRAASKPAVRAVPAPAERPKRLGYLEQREWGQMEDRILEAEARLQSCRSAAADPAVASDHQLLGDRLRELAAAQAEVETLYSRWAELEAKLKANA